MKHHKVGLLLSKYFKRKKKKNPRYSVRAFARDLGVAPSFASNLLNGKKMISAQKLDRLSQVLDLDEAVIAMLTKSVVPVAKVNPLSEFEPIENKNLSFINPWFNVAILDLMTCINFNPDPKEISRRLGIHEIEVINSLKLLESLGLAKKTTDGYKKTDRLLRVPVKQSLREIREFHRVMIKKSLLHLTENDYENRLITGVTIATNRENIKKAKAKMNEAMHEITQILCEGDCTELFQLNLQLFQLTK